MKTKILVLVGIAICTVLLTSPVLASAAYSKIYGDANEDDVLDMRDVTYIKLVIFGKKPTTTFADANYDGKISMLDVGQTKLIILGKEKKLTLVDQVDRVVTVPRLLERVITLSPEALRVIIALDAADKLMGTDFHSPKYVFDTYPVFPEGKKLPTVGSGSDPNLELIVSLKPDVVLAYGGMSDYSEGINSIQNLGIPCVCVYSYKTWDKIFEEIEIIGIVLGKEKEAEELISYFTTKNAEVDEITSQIPDSEKPTVYLAFGSPITKRTPVVYEPVDLAGGILVTRNIPPTWGGTRADVSKEQIIAWNPDIILIQHHWKTSEPTVEDVLSDPDLQPINAVKNRRVYYTLSGLTFYMADHPRVFTETLIMAKLFHPEKFEDLDLEKEGNEIFERFYHVDGLWTELGTELGFI